MNFLLKIFRYINTGQKRSVKAKKNILVSFGLKGVSILISLAYVPLLINALGKEEYGIWLILTSFMAWIAFFDVGIGNGTRNYLGKALAVKNEALAKAYISTTYAVFFLIFIPLILLIFFITPFISWQSIFNTIIIPERTLKMIAAIVLSFFALRLIVQTINILLLADQRPAMTGLISVTSNVLSFIIIFILHKMHIDSFVLYCLILCVIPVLVFIIYSLILFSIRYKSIKPSIASIDFSLTKNILNLGVKFFIIQISGIIIYSSTNLIITQFYDPTAVTSYNIVFKYFSVVTMVYGILISPLWSSVTEAYELGDMKWLKNTIKKYNYVSGILAVGIIIMLSVSSFVYRWWVGSDIFIPFSLSAVVALQTLMYVIFTPYVSFLNGVGKIKLVTYFVVIQSLIYIPLVFVFNKYLAIGVAGILLVSIVIELPLKITQYIQTNKIINQKAKGIWNV